MPTKTEQSRRQALMQRVNDPELLDPTPIEIPADAKQAGRSIEDQIQEQIALHLAKKHPG